jgi:hypothetical protein
VYCRIIERQRADRKALHVIKAGLIYVGAMDALDLDLETVNALRF